MKRGKIKWYNARKGYGFIIGNDGNEYFVHSTEKDSDWFPYDGEEVTFHWEKTERGLKATEVKKAEVESEKDEKK